VPLWLCVHVELHPSYRPHLESHVLSVPHDIRETRATDDDETAINNTGHEYQYNETEVDDNVTFATRM
jgi:hypothetical protein